MANFLGFIEVKNQYYNLCLTHEITGKYINELTDEDFDFYLPDSTFRKIVLTYNMNDQAAISFMENHFQENEFFVVSFETSDLEQYDNTAGRRSYRLIARDAVINKKLFSINEKGLFLYIEREFVDTSTMEKGYVVIDTPFAGERTKAYVEVENHMVVGPCTVSRRIYDGKLIAKINSGNTSRIVDSYKEDAFTKVRTWVGYDEQEVIICVIKDDAQKCSTDLMDDEALIESFRDSIKDASLGSNGINFGNIDALIEHYRNSALTGDIPEEIKSKRLRRLTEIMTSETDVAETLGLISDSLCDLLIKYQNTDKVTELFEALIKNSDFVDKFQNARIVQDKISRLEEQKSQLEQQIKDATKQIDESKVETEVSENSELDREYIKKTEEYNALMEKITLAKGVNDLDTYQKKLSGEVEYLEQRKAHLQNDAKDLETQFTSAINSYHDKMVNIAFDGFMASKMLDAATSWDSNETEKKYFDLAEKINKDDSVKDMEPDELIRYICDSVKKERPQYEENVIINIAICMTQSFLTVFSGEPGCGKTSICNLMGKVLGLNVEKERDTYVSRYVPISVERGWTSKRDFVGYYNPLAKTFDKSNARVYDGLKVLDIEAKKNWNRMPFVILLDEANLSPMEYYWADFMNICDELSSDSFINLGEGNVFAIPETLHFVATINNDHTTEILSPRLIDRAFIVTLPSNMSIEFGNELEVDDIKKISWQSLKKAFIPELKDVKLTPEAKTIYDKIVSYMRNKMRMSISPRTEMAIQKYCVIAEKRFVKDEERNIDTSIIALDYAVAQKILPKITGNGVEDEGKLTELESLLSVSNLEMSSKIVSDIIERGNRKMKSFEFFN